MSQALNGMLALKAIRVRREERLSSLRLHHVRQCEQIEQAMRETRQRSEQASMSLRQRKQARWSQIYGHDFDSLAIRRGYQADREDMQYMAQSDAALHRLEARLEQAQAALVQVAADHAQCVRRLEACKELLTWQDRQRARRATAREEATAEALHGARRGC